MRFIINSEFKAIMKGEFAEHNHAAGEFVLDTSDTESATGAIITGVAEAMGVEVTGKTKADKLASLEAGLNKLKIGEVREPTVTQKITALVEGFVKDGKLTKSEDDLIVEIINSGVGFKVAARTLKHVLETTGLKVSNKDRLSTASSILEKMNDGAGFAPTNWGDVIDAAEKIASGLPDTNEKQAIVAIKKWAKEANITLPAKPEKVKGEKSEGGVSGFKAKVTAALVKNPKMTKEDLEAFCVENKKDAAVAKRFEWVRALANKLAK